MNERLSYFRQKNKGREYAQCISRSSKRYLAFMSATTQLAIDFIDIDDRTYQQSEVEARTKPEMTTRMLQDEEEVRLIVERKENNSSSSSVPAASREVMKHIIMFKAKLEGESIKKLHSVKLSAGTDEKVVQMIEHSRILDTIYLKHGMKAVDLIYAAKEYDLDNDPDVKAI